MVNFQLYRLEAELMPFKVPQEEWGIIKLAQASQPPLMCHSMFLESLRKASKYLQRVTSDGSIFQKPQKCTGCDA